MSDWIEWKGGECPVLGLELVDVRFRDGSTAERESASTWGWRKDGSAHDIIAYRVVPE